MIYLVGFLAPFILFQLVWIPAYLKKRNDFADVAWGFGFVLASWAAYIYERSHHEITPAALIVCALVTIWGLRLTYHVGLRNLGKKTEDERYGKWRSEWGSTWIWRSYLQVFVLQALILFVIELSVIALLNAEDSPPVAALAIGFVIWLVGFFFEAVGDHQLGVFTSNKANKGKFIETGLWKISRHPNYFGEVTQWWGIYIIACGVPYGWMTLPAPITITILILKVSGVSMLEDHMRKRPGFDAYARRVPKFIPWIGKRA